MHVFDYLVALASSSFEALSVDDAYFTAIVGDQIALSQRNRSLGYANPPHPQHVAKQLLREMELI